MIDNTAAQAELHPPLISDDAQQLIELAREQGAIGWKVNGAGGEGGSVTLLCGPDASARRKLLRMIVEANPLFQPIPICVSRIGLRVWTCVTERGFGYWVLEIPFSAFPTPNAQHLRRKRFSLITCASSRSIAAWAAAATLDRPPAADAAIHGPTWA